MGTHIWALTLHFVGSRQITWCVGLHVPRLSLGNIIVSEFVPRDGADYMQ
jgi:hypothetical protein